jgi:hypothetical protein
MQNFTHKPANLLKLKGSVFERDQVTENKVVIRSNPSTDGEIWVLEPREGYQPGVEDSAARDVAGTGK